MVKEKRSMENITYKLDQICLTEEMADVFFSFQLKNIAQIPAHRMILALRSPVFKAMFYGSFPQSEGNIRIEDITPDTFKIMLRYLYTDHLQLSKDSVFPLMYAAQKYQIAGLISKCEKYLQKKLAVNNACTLFSHAKFFTMDKLKTNALKYIADNAMEVFKNDDFLLLSSENLVDIIKLDSLCIPEVEVFRAVLSWVDLKLTQSKIKIDGESRRDGLLKDGILFTIAVPLLSLEDFTSVVIPSSILTHEEQLQIFKALTIPNSASSCGKFRVCPRKGGKIVEVLVNDILYPGNINPRIRNHWGNLEAETFSVKTNNKIMFKSVTIKPRFQNPSSENNWNFNVKCFLQNTFTETDDSGESEDLESSDSETSTEERSVVINLACDGSGYKFPIDEFVSQNEMLVMTFQPIDYTRGHRVWKSEARKYMIIILPDEDERFDGMMYQHKLSDQTTLNLSLTGGHLVESLEVMELN
ncbi:BTB/POZ domain-containing protein 6-like [Mytilus galloprovincialis]|uniref:BTB/POZ domain-containing protein 6-like n=1 Tax=Mytilus galloprovincialis TaxID=29158 RepID=UPI003F7C99D8